MHHHSRLLLLKNVSWLSPGNFRTLPLASTILDSSTVMGMISLLLRSAIYQAKHEKVSYYVTVELDENYLIGKPEQSCTCLGET